MEKGKVYRVKVSRYIAKQKDIFRSFVATPLRETPKAVYLYGRGTTKGHVSCMACGRTLTNDISRFLGIGPICGGHFYDVELTIANKKELEKLIVGTIIEGWFPKASSKFSDSDEIVEVPTNHKMLDKTRDTKEEKKKAELKEGFIGIFFPYDPKTIARVKTLSGRRFNREPEPHWVAPFSLESAQQLKEWGFLLGPRLNKAILDHSYVETAEEVAKTLDIPGLKGELYPFQHKGVAFIESRNGKALIADEMGLGKTIQVIGWLQMHLDVRPAVIIVPASLKLNWAREIRNWMGSDEVVAIIDGRLNGDTAPLPDASIYIINYDIISVVEHDKCEACRGSGLYREMVNCHTCKGTGKGKRHVYFREDILKLNPQVVVLDECHYIKNNKAQRTLAIQRLKKSVPFRIALSGTPIVNRPIEFFNTLSFIAPERFPSFWNYAKTYCGAVHNGYGWDFTGASNTKELHDILTSSIMIRRLKKDVLKDLPPKVRSVIPLPITNRKRYNKASADFIAYLKIVDEEKVGAAQKAETLVKIEALKQLAVKGKIGSIVEWVRDYLDNEEKLVVFTTHQSVIDELAQELSEFSPVILDGRTPNTKRQEGVDRFQTDSDCRLFLGNIKAAGVGLTLTAANATCFVELGWTPGEHDQAEDRVHRIGQVADSVSAYYLVAENTVEEEISLLLDEKRGVLSQVLDGEDVAESSLLTALLRTIRKEARE